MSKFRNWFYGGFRRCDPLGWGGGFSRWPRCRWLWGAGCGVVPTTRTDDGGIRVRRLAGGMIKKGMYFGKCL